MMTYNVSRETYDRLELCRQALSEFCDPQMPVAVCGAAGEAELTTLGALLPHAFDGRNLT